MQENEGIPFISFDRGWTTLPIELSVMEAQLILDEFVHKTQNQDFLNQDIAYINRGTVKYEGLNHYQIDLSERIVKGNRWQYNPLYHYVISREGVIYVVNESGAYEQCYDVSSDSWGGEFLSETGILTLENYNTQSFDFTFTLQDAETFDGLATLRSDEQNQAEYKDLLFELDGDVMTVTLIDDAEGDEHAAFTGTYNRK